MDWEPLEDLFLRVAHVLGTDDSRKKLPRIAPPIPPAVDEAARCWIEAWIENPKNPLPSGDVRAACFARFYAATILVAHARAFAIPAIPDEALGAEPVKTALRRLLVELWPFQTSQLWAEHWKLSE